MAVVIMLAIYSLGHQLHGLEPATQWPTNKTKKVHSWLAEWTVRLSPASE